MKIRIEVQPGELKEKGSALVRAIADQLRVEDPDLAKALDVIAASSEELRKAESVEKGPLIAQMAASQSLMGNRAVHTGSTGLNIQAHSPVQLKPENDTRSNRAPLAGMLESEKELAFRRESMKPRKEGLYLMFGTPIEPEEASKEIEDFEGLADAQREMGIEAPRRRKELGIHAKQFRGTPVKEAFGLMLPANKRKPGTAPYRAAIAMAPAPIVKASDGVTLQASASAPMVPLTSGPLAVGHRHTVKKRGLGEVTLEAIDAKRFAVHMDGFDAQEFVSLSAACDHVWAKQKGYEDAMQYKQEHSKNKVPSGAGWKFWGLNGAAA